ncbi:MAG TPA: alpha-ketoglutarate-dependent dioxygenase AlkB, partial [Acetobacteraceae bacterium]
MSLREGMDDLFGSIPISVGASEPLDDGAVLLRGFVATDAPGLLRALEPVLAGAPFRHMVTPGGHAMSVAMTNCGRVGWITDRTGYRYDATDPETGRAWPAMSPLFLNVAARAAMAGGYAGFVPDGCLINRYVPG